MPNNDNPIVTIKLGDSRRIVLELYPQKAPGTVANFIALAQSGFYDGTIFHRIIDGFMIQGGDPEGSGMGGPGYAIRGEFAHNGFADNDIVHTPGVISMARSANFDSAGSQFFIMVGEAPHLDGQYAAFGRVADEESLAVCLDLAKSRTLGRMVNDRPVEPPVMEKLSVDTKGLDYGQPEKLPQIDS